MKFLSILILVILMGMVSLKAQSDPGCMSFNKPWRNITFFIPGLVTGFKIKEENYGTRKPTPVVFRSPVKHTAFFCRMEDATVKKFGIMIQFHAGDYASWMDKKIR